MYLTVFSWMPYSFPNLRLFSLYSLSDILPAISARFCLLNKGGGICKSTPDHKELYIRKGPQVDPGRTPGAGPSHHSMITVHSLITVQSLTVTKPFSGFHENPSRTTAPRNRPWREGENPQKINLSAMLDP